jgi:thioredoxin reductase (NADPH)
MTIYAGHGAFLRHVYSHQLPRISVCDVGNVLGAASTPVVIGRNAPMKPRIFLVDDDGAALERLRHDLRRRYGADYEIAGTTYAVEALTQLDKMRSAGTEVALLIADQWMPDVTGTEFLVQAHEIAPNAQRLLMIDVGDVSARGPIVKALILNQLDYYFGKPWASPEEELYPVTGEALRMWAKSNLPRYEKLSIVAPHDHVRAHKIRDVAERNGVATGFYPSDSAEGQALLDKHAPETDRFPVLVLYDGRVLVDPAHDEIARAMGAETEPDDLLYDVTIVGGGPAGLAAAVYAASEGLHTSVIEPDVVGGQASMSSMIRNYFGFPWGIGGSDLTERGEAQATGFGARFVLSRTATALREEDDNRVLTLSNGTEVRSRTVVISTGVAYRRLDVPGIAPLVGAGVFYGASFADAQSLSGVDVYILGGGNSAGQAALHLARMGARVTILIRGDSLAKRMSGYLVNEIESDGRVRTRLNTQVSKAIGHQRLEGLVLNDSSTSMTEEVPAAALYVLIGAVPRTEWLRPVLACDDHGFLLTGPDLLGSADGGWPLGRQPLLFETSMPGVFAAGDVRHGSGKRVAAAVGEGSTAVLLVRDYLRRLDSVDHGATPPPSGGA